MKIQNNIAHNLTTLRQLNQFSQEQVAEQIGVSRQAVAKWEAGQSVPDILNCDALAKLYNVELDDLIHYDQEQTGKSIPPMLILLFSMCIFRIIWIQLAVPHYDNIDGVFILYPISWVIGVVLMALYTWKGHWLHYGDEKEKAKKA